MGWFGSKYSCKSVKHPLLLHKNVTQSQPCRTFSCRNHNLPTTCGAKKRRQRGRVKNRKSGIYGSAGVARLQSIWGLASLSAESMWTLATVWTTRNRYFCELPSTNWNTAHGCHQQVYVTFRTFLLWQRPNNGQQVLWRAVKYWPKMAAVKYDETGVTCMLLYTCNIPHILRNFHSLCCFQYLLM